MFEHLKHLIQTKQKLNQDLNLDSGFTPFMAQRWISMYNVDHAIVVNESTNRLYQGLPEKNYWYKMLQVLTPCNPYRYIKYIKKSKKEKQINSKYIDFVASSLEISKREASIFIANNSNVIKQLKKTLGD